MAYESIVLKEELSIASVVSIHYFEYMNTFSYEGESHNFWEFLCVDKGVVNVEADGVPHTLSKGQIIFHKPNEFHKVRANGQIAPNLVVMSFYCTSPCMKFFENKILTITDSDRNLMAQILVEARRCFSTPLDDPYLQKIERKENAPFASEQMIRLHLETLILGMLCRNAVSSHPAQAPVKSIKKSYDEMIYQKVLDYLREHIHEKISIDDICTSVLIGSSPLQKLFRERHGCGVIRYFSELKIEQAKEQIRENNLNFTQISEYLGYTSVHYFSRQFKQLTGMTPSEYASSIKGLSERTDSGLYPPP